MKKLMILILAVAGTVGLYAQTQPVRMFAHRGGRSEYEENTLATFEKCSRMGMNGFETDVRLTADGVFVISHDANMKRMFGVDCIIEETTLEELRKLRTPGGSPIMTLDELLEFLKHRRNLYVEFEMKVSDTKAYPREKLEKYCDDLFEKVMAARPSGATYLLTSFDTRALRYLTVKHPEGDYLFISGEPVSEKTVAQAQALGIRRIGCNLSGTSRQAVAKAHEAGMIVSLWPGTSFADFLCGVCLGADYLCSDIPIEVVRKTAASAPWVNLIH